MTDNRLNAEVIFVGRGFRFCQHIFGIENVKTFILHGPHVEEVHRHDHKDVEVILQAETLLIPFHAVFQRRHRPVGAVEIPAINEDLQRHITA